MITISIKLDDLFTLVSQTSIYISEPVGADPSTLADVLQMTEDERIFFDNNIATCATDVFRKLGRNACTDYPGFEITDGNNKIPNSIIYRVTLYDGASEFVVLPLLQNAITETLVNCIILKWLEAKSYVNYIPIKMRDLENSKDAIKSALMYGQRAKRNYDIYG